MAPNVPWSSTTRVWCSWRIVQAQSAGFMRTLSERAMRSSTTAARFASMYPGFFAGTANRTRQGKSSLLTATFDLRMVRKSAKSLQKRRLRRLGLGHVPATAVLGKRIGAKWRRKPRFVELASGYRYPQRCVQRSSEMTTVYATFRQQRHRERLRRRLRLILSNFCRVISQGCKQSQNQRLPLILTNFRFFARFRFTKGNQA